MELESHKTRRATFDFLTHLDCGLLATFFIRPLLVNYLARTYVELMWNLCGQYCYVNNE